MFSDALEAATTIESGGAELVLAGENSVVRLVPLSQPELRGELPRTAAGETLPIEGGSVFTISADWARHPGNSVLYLLTAAEPGSSEPPTWTPWKGEVEVPPAPAGSVEVVMPDDIAVGDYRLCSPYWTDNFFCHDLLVRPPSAPWYVTAGPDGVILHDADGTSEPVWDEPVGIAFWFEEMLLLEATDGSVTAVPHAGTRYEVTPAGSRLLDAAVVGGSPAALVVREGRTVLIDVESGEEADLGGEAIEGLIADGSLILRAGSSRIEAHSSDDGSVRWELEVDAEEMMSLSSPAELRLDRGRLAEDGSFMQYLDTRLVDIVTGEVIAEFSTELAVPLEGDEMTEMCVRAELRDSLMLCPQPDGRFLTVQVARTPDEFGGDQLSIPGLSDVTGTYVRSEP